jgi:cyanophycin synthetase
VDGNNEAIVAARAEGKRAVFVKDGAIVLATGAEEVPVARLARIAMLANGAGDKPGVLSNLLGAVAGAWALGVAPDIIRAGVKPYDPTAPLRAD